MKPLRIFTWHVHGSYLYYLSNSSHEFHLPVKPGRPEGYGGRPEGGFPWPPNVKEIAAEEVAGGQFDCILYQSHRNYLSDQYEILSEEQRRLPRIYLEHDPPRENPTDTRHPVDDPNILLVHVTHFNQLMWDCGATPTRVIEHGVTVPRNTRYSGVLPRGLVVANGLQSRGRRLGADVFQRARREVPLDLVGMQSQRMGGLGEVPHAALPAFAARYRFFFNPIRYTSLGLSVCEAMMLGLPVVALATTEMVTVVENGVSGYVSTDADWLCARMQALLDDKALARFLGEGARRQAQARFGIDRFRRDWNAVFEEVTGIRTMRERLPGLSGAGEHP